MGRGFFSSNPFHFCPNPGTFLCHPFVSSLSPSLSTFSPFFQLGLAQQDTSIPSLLVVFVLTFPLLPVSSTALHPTLKANCSINWQQPPQQNVTNFIYSLSTRFKVHIDSILTLKHWWVIGQICRCINL